MRPRSTSLFWVKAWTSGAVGLVVAALVYITLIHPSIILVSQREEAEQDHQSAEDNYFQAVSALKTVQSRIEAKTERLEELGGAPIPESQKDLMIAKITGLAAEEGVTIENFSPLDMLDAVDHRAFFVQFSARGPFEDVCSYLKRIENDVDFVDITHISVTRNPRFAESVCLVQWSCRINTQRLADLQSHLPQVASALASAISKGGVHVP